MNANTPDLIGLCWIPNLSGKITRSEAVDVIFKERVTASNYSFDWNALSRCVLVSDSTKPSVRIRIDFVDSSGLCHIFNLGEERFKLDYDTESSYIVKEIWMELRQMIDSSSMPSSNNNIDSKSAKSNCVCNAMDWPIPFDESMMTNQYDLILDEFLRNGDDHSDDSRHLESMIKCDLFGNETPDSIKHRMGVESVSLAIQSINSLYMDSFISIYAKKIVNVSRYKNENVLITRKLEMISKYNNDSAQIDNLCLSSNSIRITRWGLIVASVAMGLNILSLVLTNI